MATGGYGADQQQVIRDKDQYIQAALARGLSQAKIDTFIAENPGDYHRLSTQSPDQAPMQGLQGAAPTETGAAAPDMGQAGGGPTSTVPTGASSTTPSEGTVSAQSASGLAGVESALPIISDYGQVPLRQGLGSRTPPSLYSALAGLKRVY